MKWLIVNESYLEYLRTNGDNRIPKSNYGETKYKPFFGSLFEENDCYYVTQISHPQKKHYSMKDSVDFKKIYLPDTNHLLAVVNLNYMFPIPKELYSELKYQNITQYKEFKTDVDKGKYIDLLRRELEVINGMDLSHLAREVYFNKYDNPGSSLAKRSLDYKALEELAKKYHCDS